MWGQTSSSSTTSGLEAFGAASSLVPPTGPSSEGMRPPAVIPSTARNRASSHAIPQVGGRHESQLRLNAPLPWYPGTCEESRAPPHSELNPFKINTSTSGDSKRLTLPSKSFRMHTYKNRGEGVAYTRATPKDDLPSSAGDFNSHSAGRRCSRTAVRESETQREPASLPD